MVRVGTVVRTLILCGLALTTLAFAQTNENTTQAPTVRQPIRFAISPPMFAVPQSVGSPDMKVHEVLSINRNLGPGGEDGALQTEFGPLINGTPGIDFEGIGFNIDGEPSDNNMAVGPNHIVETVNTEWAVYDKTGHIAAGFPKSLGSIWTSLGGACTGNQGDPIVQYDRLADRWFLSQIGSESVPYSLCQAVSKTNDPTGAYSLYEYSFGNNFPDYPHYSVWPTASNPAYLQMAHLFLNLQGFVGTAACAYDRTAMLAGKANPVQICFTIANDGGFQPSDLDGATAPPAGSPGYFITFETTSLHQFQLTPNFANPGASTFVGPINIPVSTFSPSCGGTGGTCVPQKGTTQQLDTLGDRMMYRLAYRNFGDHEALVVNHAVTSVSSVAPRWYEIRTPNNTPTIFQQGTYAPDSTFRWMGSMAMDKAGDMLLSYSVSSSSIDPGLAYTGRVPTDAAGTMESENTLLTGTHFQAGHSRWGDYSAARIDPSDDCTFWFVNQYLKTSGDFVWATHIGSFAFTGCGGGGGPAVTLSPTSLVFSKTIVGHTSTGKNVTLTNSGTATLNITSIAVSGDFALVTSTKPCGATLAAGAHCIIRVTFTPTQLGARTGNITITDNAANSPQTVPLSGTGIAPVTLTPSSATYAAQTVGTTSLPKTFTLKNNQSVTLNSIVISTTGDFSVTTTTCGTSLAAKTGCTIKVVFKPTAKGTRTGKLNVADNASNSPQTSSLTGTGK
jgi:Abnormal spindle-like microcephaly-assoc'd, ASPM-SPD-2-Hydin